MTFKEAYEVIYASDSDRLAEAIQAVKYFRSNILDLEDYEVDQLHEALRYIKVNKLEES